MKFLTIYTLSFFFLSSVFCQTYSDEEISQFLKKTHIENSASCPHPGHEIKNLGIFHDIASLLQDGVSGAKVAEIAKQNFENDYVIGKSILYIGLSQSSDLNSVELLKSKAFHINSYQKNALASLFRIGEDKIIEETLDYLLLSDNEYLQDKYLINLWTLEDVSSLKAIESYLEKFISGNPQKRVTNLCKVLLLPRIQKIISFHTRLEYNEQIDFIESILEWKNSDFRGVSGGRAHLWALNQLVKIYENDADKSATIDWLQNLKNEATDPGHYKEFLLFAIDRIGGELTNQEIDWINRNVSSPLFYSIDIFKNKKTFLNYYDFKQECMRQH